MSAGVLRGVLIDTSDEEETNHLTRAASQPTVNRETPPPRRRFLRDNPGFCGAGFIVFSVN